MSGREISEEEIQQIEGFIERSKGIPAGWVALSPGTYDRFHDGYVALTKALSAYRSALRSGERESEQLREMGDAAFAMDANLMQRTTRGRQRIWVSENRCTLLTIWYDTPSDYIVGKPANVTVARRDDPSHTWGPPITLTEEKT